jgi:endonuclease/exonuclease/phosphatase (EEP) superfamily protein YafD
MRAARDQLLGDNETEQIGIQAMLSRLKAMFVSMRNSVVALSLVTALLLLAVTLVGFLPGRGYFIDQLSQLRLLYLMGALVLLALAAILHARRLAVVACVCFLANGIACLPLFVPAFDAGAIEGKLDVMAANVYGDRNHQYDRLIALVHQRQPQVLCLEEVNPGWLAVLRKRLTDYPYSLSQATYGGTAIFSKLPIEQTSNATSKYGVEGQLEWNGKHVVVVAEHPPAPYRAESWRRRNKEFLRLVQDVGASSLPVVLAGDFNSTPWSWYFQRFVADAGLHDSETGQGLQPTWSAYMPLPLVPIDHCLYTDQFTTIKREIGPDIGSDHLPLLVELGLRKSAPKDGRLLSGL